MPAPFTAPLKSGQASVRAHTGKIMPDKSQELQAFINSLPAKLDGKKINVDYQ